MSMEPSFDPGFTPGECVGDQALETHAGDGTGHIRRQASEIIKAVLSDAAPGQEMIRESLRKHVADHPDRPERALLEHLISLRGLTGYLPSRAVPERESISDRIEAVLGGGLLLTAFQPIFQLSTGQSVGAEAFTRFVTDGADTAEDWFAAAGQADMGSDLEFATLESALAAAPQLPAHLYVALKLSPGTCLDPLLPGVLDRSPVARNRLVLELTEALTLEQPDALLRALAPLRKTGVRLAIDHAGSYFASLGHIRYLEPDIVKLDRNIIAGIDKDPLRHTLGEAMAGIARQLGAEIIAEGVETPGELATVTALGMTAAQGYLLGRPTPVPRDWAGWALPEQEIRSGTDSDGSVHARPGQ